MRGIKIFSIFGKICDWKKGGGVWRSSRRSILRWTERTLELPKAQREGFDIDAAPAGGSARMADSAEVNPIWIRPIGLSVRNQVRLPEGRAWIAHQIAGGKGCSQQQGSAFWRGHPYVWESPCIVEDEFGEVNF
jgi:hypothetical protein